MASLLAERRHFLNCFEYSFFFAILLFVSSFLNEMYERECLHAKFPDDLSHESFNLFSRFSAQGP